MISAQRAIMMCDTQRICFSLGSGLIYVPYTSYVRTDDTAICSADEADVTAKKSRMSMATAPDLPMSAAAALTAGRPADTSSVVSVMSGVSRPLARATAASPSELAIPIGMPNH